MFKRNSKRKDKRAKQNAKGIWLPTVPPKLIPDCRLFYREYQKQAG